MLCFFIYYGCELFKAFDALIAPCPFDLGGGIAEYFGAR